MRMSRIAIVLAAALPIAGVAQPAERTGEQIVKQQCAGCHEKGVNGAPRIDDRAAWVPRMKQGLDAMVRSAINGHGKMPARGGLVNVTDTELRSAITYMFNPAGIPPKPSPPPALGPNQKVVDGTEIYLGVAPKGGDVHIVTITLRDAQTHKPIEGARVEVKVTNPVMGAQTKKLESMKSGEVVSYAAEFRISGKEPHVISVEIHRPQGRTIETKFDYKS
jgi:cytochrome c5